MDIWHYISRQTRKEYSAGARLAAISGEALVFVIVIPALLYCSSTVGDDGWRFESSQTFSVFCLILAALGLFLGLWTVWVQYRHARGTPVPIMATKKLLTDGPYSLSRNPMLLGTILYYAGVSAYTSSIVAILGTVLFSVSMIVFVKLVEEREMSLRFGEEYSSYVQQTPFIIPRLFSSRKKSGS
jgi:protein-S-isoprenylcysteine O-methyltransferase Ste14